MKSLLAVTALSLTASFATPVFAQAVPSQIRDVIAACAADPSVCVAQFAALDLSSLNQGQRRAVANALTQAAASNPALSDAFVAIAAAVESNTGIDEAIVANLASPA